MLTLVLMSMMGCPAPATTSDSSTDGQPVPACEPSTPIPLMDGTASGFERCADGRVHRASVVGAGAPGDADVCTGDEIYIGCNGDNSCGQGELCRQTGANDDVCRCVYTCRDDADCFNKVCVAQALQTGADYPSCKTGFCTVDTDCASGLCGLSRACDGGDTFVGLACRTEADGCRTDADCGAGEVCALALNPSKEVTDAWECQPSDCAAR